MMRNTLPVCVLYLQSRGDFDNGDGSPDIYNVASYTMAVFSKVQKTQPCLTGHPVGGGATGGGEESTEETI